MTLILRPEDTRGLISMAEAVEATEIAFRDWGHNHGLNAPRRRIHVPSGVRVSVHQGAAPSFGATGLFTHCEWVRPLAEHQVYPNIAHPAYVLFSSANGDLETIIIGELTPSEWPDVKALTGVRTAATSVVGTRLLAREGAATIGLFGGGQQSKVHLAGLLSVMPIQRVKVYRRDPRKRAEFADEVGEVLGLQVEPVSSARECVRDIDVILAATNSSVPVFDGAWLEPGQHVTSIVGSNVGLVQAGFTPRKRREIDDTTLTRANVIVVANKEQVVQDQQGDLWDPAQAGVISLEDVHDLGEVLAGLRPGRTSAEQITLYKNNAGQGIADVAIGARVAARARERGLGFELPIAERASDSITPDPVG
jgi:ornithine cyclodeaminase